MSAKVLLLHDDDLFEEEVNRYWTIHSSLPDYRLVYRMNSALDMNLSRTLEDHISIASGVHYGHPQFAWHDEYNDLHWALLANRGTEQVDESNSRGGLFDSPRQLTLLPANNKADYILILMDEAEEEHLRDLLSRLRRVSGVQATSAYEPNKQSVREALRVEIEKYPV